MEKEILNDFLIKKVEGYYCSYGDFYLDPLYPIQNAVVSHAHGDHATPGHNFVYSTKATKDIMLLRYGNSRREKFLEVAFHEKFQLGGVQLTFIPAGHILGSAQILMEYKGVKYLYTGDIKSQADATCEPIEYIQADVLITETTFAHPDFSHPDVEQEILKLNISSNIMLGAYALGKAQRLTQLLNQHLPGKRIFVHHSMYKIHKIYESYGFRLGPYELYNRKVMKETRENAVYIIPPMTFNTYVRAKNVFRVFATGWKKRVNADLTLHISDHVDWNDLLELIDKVNPVEIWTIHGDSNYLINNLQSQFRIRELV